MWRVATLAAARAARTGIVLNAVMLTFVSFSRALVNLSPKLSNPYAAEGGQIFALFIIAVAAAEAAVALAIALNFYNSFSTCNMSFFIVERLFFCPPSVSIHNDDNMFRDIFRINKG